MMQHEHGEGEHRRIGARLVSAGALTAEQRDTVLTQQEAMNAEGKHVRFGELAVQMGFCTHTQVESLPGYLGEKLVDAGLLTQEQRNLLVTWQEKLRQKGIHVRFGELVASEGLCTSAQVESVISIMGDTPPTRH